MADQFKSITSTSEFEQAALVSLNAIGDAGAPNREELQEWYNAVQEHRKVRHYHRSSTIFVTGIQAWCGRSSDHRKAFSSAAVLVTAFLKPRYRSDHLPYTVPFTGSSYHHQSFGYKKYKCRFFLPLAHTISELSDIIDAWDQESLEEATLRYLQDMADGTKAMTVENVKFWKEAAQSTRDKLNIPTSSIELDAGILGVLQRLTEVQSNIMVEALP